MGTLNTRFIMKTHKFILGLSLIILLATQEAESKKKCKKKCPPKPPCKNKDKNLPAEVPGIGTKVISWCGTEKCSEDSCAIPCPLPLGYYADPNDCSAYCYCSGVDAMDKNSGVRVPSRYEKCPNGLLWDPLCQGDFEWLPGQEGNLGSTGGCCNWPAMVKTDHCDLQN